MGVLSVPVGYRRLELGKRPASALVPNGNEWAGFPLAGTKSPHKAPSEWAYCCPMAGAEGGEGDGVMWGGPNIEAGRLGIGRAEAID